MAVKSPGENKIQKIKLEGHFASGVYTHGLHYDIKGRDEAH